MKISVSQSLPKKHCNRDSAPYSSWLDVPVSTKHVTKCEIFKHLQTGTPQRWICTHLLWARWFWEYSVILFGIIKWWPCTVCPLISPLLSHIKFVSSIVSYLHMFPQGTVNWRKQVIKEKSKFPVSLYIIFYK